MDPIKEKSSLLESPVYSNLLLALNSVHNALGEKSPLNVSPGIVGIDLGGKRLVEIGNQNIKIAGKSYSSKLTTSERSNTFPNEQFVNFLNAILPNIVRLNHIGIGYSAPNLDVEGEEVQEHVLQSGLHLYEEPTDEENQKWLFVGNADDWEKPLFELVLRKAEDGTVDEWVPHFQIDLDTTLSVEEMRRITTECFGEGFITWTLDIPELGTVLGMGVMGEVNDVKITLGLGTDKRGTEFHRKEVLRKLV